MTDCLSVCICTDMTEKLNLSAMENCLCFKLRWISRAVTQYFTARLNRHGLLPTQTPSLAALALQPGAGMAELSDSLGMDRTTLIRNLRPLERAGLVRLRGKGRGGRVALSITPKGKAALARLMPDWRAAQRAVVETLGEKRWSAIVTDLERAGLALSK